MTPRPTRRFVVSILALAACLSAVPAAPLPAELRLIPGDAAVFLHADVAALYDSKVGDPFKGGKSELSQKLGDLTKAIGLTLADLKTVAFVIPGGADNRELQRGFVVVTTRKPYDRDQLVAKLKADAVKLKDECKVTGHVVRVQSPRTGNRVQVTDASDPGRLVILNDLPESYLKPAADAPAGPHADAIRTAATAPAVAAVNLTALPDELRGDNLPPELRPFQPIIKADTLTAVGTLTQEHMAVTVRVRSREKANAGEVEKSFGAVQTLVGLTFPQMKKRYEKDLADPKPMAKLLGLVEAAVRDAKFSVDGADTVASLRLPIDAPVGAFFESFLGGGPAGRTQSANNLKQLGLAVYNYESAHNHYPPAATLGKKGKKLLSWRVEVLPYIEQEALYKKFNHTEPWDSEHNLKVFKDNPMPAVFALPGTKAADDKKTHYQVFVGNGAMFDTVTVHRVTDVQDGTTNTVMIATAATPVEWTRPDDVEFDPKADVKKMLLFQGGLTQFTFGDGSVRAVRETIDEKVLKALVTRSGGEVANADDD